MEAEEVELRVKRGAVDYCVRTSQSVAGDLMSRPGDRASKSSGKAHGSEHILIQVIVTFHTCC